jgi:hypothetical protein
MRRPLVSTDRYALEERKLICNASAPHPAWTLGRHRVQLPPFLAPARIGGLQLRNRLVRAAMSETMATVDGKVPGELVDLYTELAKGGAGLLSTGHC